MYQNISQIHDYITFLFDFLDFCQHRDNEDENEMPMCCPETAQ